MRAIWAETQKELFLRWHIPPVSVLLDGCLNRQRARLGLVLEKGDWFSIELGEGLKLDEIDAALAALNLSRKTGRFPKSPGDLTLSQFGIGSRRLELELEPTVGCAVEGFWHCLSLSNKQAYTPGAIAPKMGANGEAQ